MLAFTQATRPQIIQPCQTHALALDDSLINVPPVELKNYERELPVYPGGANAYPKFVPNASARASYLRHPAYDPQAPLRVSADKYKLVQAAVNEVVGDAHVDPVIKQAVSQTGYELDFGPGQTHQTGLDWGNCIDGKIAPFGLT